MFALLRSWASCGLGASNIEMPWESCKLKAELAWNDGHIFFIFVEITNRSLRYYQAAFVPVEVSSKQVPWSIEAESVPISEEKGGAEAVTEAS